MSTSPTQPTADAIVYLVEEVPGVSVNERWFISRDRGGVIWKGPTREAGEAWAAKNRIGIDFVELLSDGM
jgi:hypothetical protein